jgi:hypothetical protein
MLVIGHPVLYAGRQIVRLILSENLAALEHSRTAFASTTFGQSQDKFCGLVMIRCLPTAEINHPYQYLERSLVLESPKSDWRNVMSAYLCSKITYPLGSDKRYVMSA